MLRHIRTAVLTVMLASMAACSGGGSAPDEGTQPQGRLTLGITDTPVQDAVRVVVQFTGVEIKAAADSAPEVFDFAAPRQIDLLALAGGGSEILLDDVTLPAGLYEWIRLKVNAGRNASDSFVELNDGSVHALFIPSGNETGLKLVQGFVIAAGGSHDFTIDFDLRRSVLRPPGLDPVFLLRPALRLVNNLEVGSIEGEVAAAIAAENCEGVVYVYTGTGVTPDDLGSATEPLATAPVEMDIATGAFRYRAAFLPAGDYTAALTCEGGADDAESDDDIEFIDPQNATVTSGRATVVNFPAA